jgi:AcrR family transcriptional regulator
MKYHGHPHLQLPDEAKMTTSPFENTGDLQIKKAGRPSALHQGNVRIEIIETARRLFAKKGFEAVSVSAIAAEVGIASTTVTHHFGSKENLWREVYAQTFPAVSSGRDIIATSRQQNLSMMETVQKLLLHHSLLPLTKPHHIEFMFRALVETSSNSALGDIYATRVRYQEGFYMRLVEFGRETGELDKFSDDIQAAKIIRFALMGYYFYFEHHVLPGAVREYEHVDDFKKLISQQIEDFIKSLELVIQ